MDPLLIRQLKVHPLELDNPVPEEIKEARLAEFMTLQAEISTAKLARKIGSTVDVIIDEVDEDGAIGRSKADAPEIDGVVYLNEETHHTPGDIVRVKVHASDEHDLWANQITERKSICLNRELSTAKLAVKSPKKSISNRNRLIPYPAESSYRDNIAALR